MDTALPFGVPLGEYYYGHKNEITVEDFFDFVNNPINKDKKFEFINRRIVFMAGGTSENHNIISSYIMRKTGNYLEGHPCVLYYDFYLQLYKNGETCENIYQPDIMINCDRSRKKKGRYGEYIEGAPEFVVEIISKSTGSYDYNDKKDNYIKYGVKELWLVDLLKDKITTYTNNDTAGPIETKYTFSDKIKSTFFPDLSIDFPEILKMVDKSELDWIR